MARKRRSAVVNVYKNLAKRRQTKKDARHREKAEYLATLPKNPILRTLARMHPKRVAGFWFSKKGGRMALKIAGIGALVVVLFAAGLFAYFRKDLDAIRPEELAQRVHTTVTKYYDRRGPAGGADALLWEDKGDGDYKMVVDGKDISTYMKQATIAIEDKDFYKHGGVSVTGLVRAVVNNANGGSTQGGSTLTQQLVKQVFFTATGEAQERGIAGIPRKIKELILSIEVERMYNKDQILNLYLNESPYGGRRNGVQSAAKTYFGVDASKLDLAQSALLAAIPNQPGLYDPYNPAGQEPLIERQHLVLNEMAAQGYITKDQADKAKKVPILDNILPQSSQFENIKAPHFVQMVRADLEAELGKATVGQGGLVVTTTLDQGIQKSLEDSFDGMFNPENPKYKGIPNYAGFENAAATVEDTQTGQIVAMMGSRNYDYPGFGQNNAALSYIQPGSTIKPLVFAQLFAKKEDANKNIYGSGTVLPDTKTTFEGNYTPNDADRKFLGNIPIRSSLGLSRNIPAIRAMNISGVKDTLNLIHDAGDTPYCTQGAEKQVGLASAIGGCGTKQINHVNAFSTLARGGTYKPYSTVLEVKNSAGETIKKWQDNKSKKVIDPEVAYILADILSDDNARAGLYGRNLPGLVVDKGRVKTATKTGTSDIDGQSKDIWMMSYSPALTMGVWLGNNDPKPLKNGNSSLPGSIINEVMTYGHQEVYKKEGKWKEGDWYKKPAGIQTVGKELYPSWYNKKAANTNDKLTFDRVSKKLATTCTPDSAKVEIGVVKMTDPKTKKVTYSASEGYDASKNDDAHKCGEATPSVGAIQINPGASKVEATVNQGVANITSVSLSVDGAVVSTQPGTGAGLYSFSVAIAPGQHTYVVTVVDDLYYQDGKQIVYPSSSGP